MSDPSHLRIIAEILARQREDGTWGGVAWNRGWDSTMHALTLLRELGADPMSSDVRRAVDRVASRVTWRGCGPDECADNRFFEGEIEPCINGQVAAAGSYFRQDVGALIGRLVSEQLADGGWNCEAERGSTRSSFNTTICVLEALLAYEQAFGATAATTEARRRGESYLLERRLFRRKSTGEPIVADRKRAADPTGAPAFTRFAFPGWWHYDVLRGLDYFRAAGATPDPRMADAVALVESKRLPDGTWPLDIQWPGAMLVDLGQREGQPSPWITARARRVLDWFRPA
jgi:hypothetical protein